MDMLQSQITRIKQEIKNTKEALTSFLLSHGYKPTGKGLKSLINDMKAVAVLNKSETYAIGILDDEGFVIDTIKFNPTQVIKGVIPDDIKHQVYKIVEMKLEKDEAREEEVLSME